MVTFFQTNCHLRKMFDMYISFQKNDNKRSAYSCLRGFQQGFQGVESRLRTKLRTKVDNFKHGNHINRLKHSLFVN